MVQSTLGVAPCDQYKGEAQDILEFVGLNSNERLTRKYFSNPFEKGSILQICNEIPKVNLIKFCLD